MRLTLFAAAALVAASAAVALATPVDWPEDGRGLLDPVPQLDQRAATEPTLDLACLTEIDCDAILAPAAAPEPSAVPLPAALVLLGAAMTSLALLLRRRAEV